MSVCVPVRFEREGVLVDFGARSFCRFRPDDPDPEVGPYGAVFDQRTIDTSGVGGGLTTLAGTQWRTAGAPPDGDDANVGWVNGAAEVATFYGLNGGCIGADGYLYVSQYGAEANGLNYPFFDGGTCVRRVNRITGETSLFVGLPDESPGHMDGDASVARVAGCVALVPTTTGMFLCQQRDEFSYLSFITYEGVVSTVTSAVLNPNGMDFAEDGTIYIASNLNGIWRIRPGADPEEPMHIAVLANCANIIILDDQRTALITRYGLNKISVFDLDAEEVVHEITNVGTIPNGITKGPNNTAYFVNAGPSDPPGAEGYDKVQQVLGESPWTVTEISSDPSFYSLAACPFDGTNLYPIEYWGSSIRKFKP